MSDFTDDEDRQLVQLALQFSRNNQNILWDKLTQLMKGTKKSKNALRQRLKTLKRTHGSDLEKFRPWYFKKKFATQINLQRLQTSRRTNTKLKTPRNKQVKKRRRRRTTRELGATCSPTKTTKLERSPTLTLSPRCLKCTSTMKTEPLTSLVLLASVASTSQGVMDERSARV
ncbi:hypothetical protein AM587_10004063 [Phytophthora nicotianae]|uniref:Uncharacterized protein n=1 Tax=Phytophthora nicotianae TaxID=4792 RepID=A0A0W8CQ45_PHYNI|nr:hypothetical protein AM587_10004063 [Phytophthora nicotianae]